MGKGTTLISLMNYLTADQTPEKRYLIKNMKLVGICNMLKLPSERSTTYLKYFLDSNNIRITEMNQ